MKEYLESKILLCNDNILRLFKRFAKDYLCEDVDFEKVTLEDAVKYIEEKKHEVDKAGDFYLACFWLNVRQSFSERILSLEDVA